jgi:hypothetical protein
LNIDIDLIGERSMIRHYPESGNLAALLLAATLWLAIPALALHAIPAAYPVATALPELA